MSKHSHNQQEQNICLARLKLSAALKRSGTLSELEYLGAIQLGFIILEGNLRNLRTFIRSYRANPQLLHCIASALSRVMNGEDIAIGASAIMPGEHAGTRSTIASCAVTISLLRAGKMVSIATDKSYGEHVYKICRKGPMLSLLPVKEDIEVLFQQIGRVACLPAAGGPPPLSVA